MLPSEELFESWLLLSSQAKSSGTLKRKEPEFPSLIITRIVPNTVLKDFSLKSTVPRDLHHLPTEIKNITMQTYE